MKKRLVSLLLCAAMLGTMVAGCGKEDGGEDGPMHISVASYFFGPVDESKDEITPEVERILREKHGIDVELEPVYIEQANYGEILNTRLSGGTAPDIFLAQSDATLQEYYDQGVIKTWSEDFLKENAPDVYEFIMNGGPHQEYKDYVDLWREFSFRDDEMIILAAIKPEGSMPWKQLIYRGDWLENLGLSVPETMDDVIEIAEAFASQDPDQNGQDDTYAIAMNSTLYSTDNLPFFYANESYPNNYVMKDGAVADRGRPEEVLTPKLIRQVYGVEARVEGDGAGGVYVRYCPGK